MVQNRIILMCTEPLFGSYRGLLGLELLLPLETILLNLSLGFLFGLLQTTILAYSIRN